MLASHQYANALLSFPDLDWNVFLQNLTYVCQTEQMQSVIHNPFIAPQKVNQIILACFPNAKDEEKSLIQLLTCNKRLELVHEIRDIYQEKTRRQKRQVLVTVTTAFTATPKQKKAIENYASSHITKDQSLICDYRVDKKIIGGFILDLNGRIIDRSVIRNLDKIKLSIEGN